MNVCFSFHITFGVAVSFITHFSYHLVIVSVSQFIHEIKTTSLAVAVFQSSCNCSIVATIHQVNKAHSPVLRVILVSFFQISAVNSENTTLFVGIVPVFKLYTASQVALGFSVYVVIIHFYKLIKI